MQTIRATSDTAIGGTRGGAEVYARECKIISIIQWREDGQRSEGGRIVSRLDQEVSGGGWVFWKMEQVVSRKSRTSRGLHTFVVFLRERRQ